LVINTRGFPKLEIVLAFQINATAQSDSELLHLIQKKRATVTTVLPTVPNKRIELREN
jgi:hypothetical protein